MYFAIAVTGKNIPGVIAAIIAFLILFCTCVPSLKIFDDNITRIYKQLSKNPGKQTKG
jgi:hypothetical protein